MFQHYFFKCFSILYMFEYLVFFQLSPRKNFFATFYAITCSWYLITFLNRFWHSMHVMILDVLSLFSKLKIVYFILTTTSSLGCFINFFWGKSLMTFTAILWSCYSTIYEVNFFLKKNIVFHMHYNFMFIAFLYSSTLIKKCFAKYLRKIIFDMCCKLVFMLQLKLCDEFLKIKHHFFWHSPQTLYFDDSSLFSNVSCILCIFWCLLNFFSNENLLRKHCNLVIMIFHRFSQKYFLLFPNVLPFDDCWIWFLVIFTCTATPGSWYLITFIALGV